MNEQIIYKYWVNKSSSPFLELAKDIPVPHFTKLVYGHIFNTYILFQQLIFLEATCVWMNISLNNLISDSVSHHVRCLLALTWDWPLNSSNVSKYCFYKQWLTALKDFQSISQEHRFRYCGHIEVVSMFFFSLV